ncbi:MAG: Gfo/Idh/MocA family oxidoreductase [Vicinamibacterales bacterium]
MASLHLAILGCGAIARTHARAVRALGGEVRLSFASRDQARADAYCRDLGGAKAWGSYQAAIADPSVDAVLVAVPPRFHRALTLEALDAGKHVMVEKPAFPAMDDFLAVQAARDRAGRQVIVAENDHYKPLVRTLHRLVRDGVVGDMLFVRLTTIADRQKPADDWRNDETMAGGDAFFEEGIHWLHIAGSVGPRIVRAHGVRPTVPRRGADQRAKSMLASLTYDNGAAGAIFYSREAPVLFRGLSFSAIFGQRGVITFESNGGLVVVRGRGLPRVIVPGLRDIRGYQAMHRDFAAAIREGRAPEMSLERAMDDHRLMEQIYASLAPAADVVRPSV